MAETPKAGSGLTKRWHGAPVWVWVLGGSVVGFGLWRVYQARKAASAATSTTTGSGSALPADLSSYGYGPSDMGGLPSGGLFTGSVPPVLPGPSATSGGGLITPTAPGQGVFTGTGNNGVFAGTPAQATAYQQAVAAQAANANAPIATQNALANQALVAHFGTATPTIAQMIAAGPPPGSAPIASVTPVYPWTDPATGNPGSYAA